MEKFFLSLYDRHGDAIYRHCLFRVSDARVAEDLTQEVFCRVWMLCAEGTAITHPKALLYRVANNMIIDHHRKRKPERIDAIAEATGPTTHPEHDRRIDASIALETLEKLPSEERELLLMRFAEGLRVREIATQLSLTANAVSVRIHRAKHRFMNLLRDTYESP